MPHATLLDFARAVLAIEPADAPAYLQTLRGYSRTSLRHAVDAGRCDSVLRDLLCVLTWREAVARGQPDLDGSDRAGLGVRDELSLRAAWALWGVS